MRKLTSFIYFLFLLLPVTALTQVLTPVKWTFTVEQKDPAAATLVLTAVIDPGWHIYSQSGKTDEGPIPTSFQFNQTKDFQLVGGVREPKPVEENDPYFKMVVKYFSDKVTFRQKINILNKKDFKVTGTLTFLTCNDNRCLAPQDVDFSFNLKGNPGVTTEQAPAVPAAKTVPDTLKKDTLKAVKPDTAAKKPAIISIQSATPGAGRGLWSVFFWAFLAGLVAIITPCVFPMIPMTVSFFLKGSENRKKARFEATFYGFSIILIYTLPIAILIIIASLFGKGAVAADIFNWLSTHWLPNILFFLIFMIFAASFLGLFEIVLPSRFVNRMDAKAEKGGIWGPFFMAFVLVLVSFSCTGPIVGMVVVASTAGGKVIEPIVAMLGFSVAFALPFTLFAYFPAWMTRLPKSGGWMNAVKVVLGFIEIALGFKFLSVADQTYHWHILDREVYLAIWIVTFTLLGFYLLGKLRFKHDSDDPFISVPRLGLAILTFSFVVYLIPGMFGAPLKALSGYLPPETSLDFDLNRIIRDEVKMYAGNAAQPSSLCDKPKYGDFLKLPHGLDGYFDYRQALACARKQNKPIFIDFTGHGCVNCREMEANVWSAPPVLKKLREDFIIAALYVDDKTEVPESEWVTSKYDGKVKKTIGKIYADVQISRFNVNSQPYYVLLDTAGNLLTQPHAYDRSVDHFIQFLDSGLENFRKEQKTH
ncbi:MAG TPA: cytochrome c biogenesis protein CcdA [Bacteroidales bacterium]|nr:cytochrome c biogenesis protein CcdA [Bacteroidales bacterium]